jgi:hypothetical protein
LLRCVGQNSFSIDPRVSVVALFTVVVPMFFQNTHFCCFLCFPFPSTTHLFLL